MRASLLLLLEGVIVVLIGGVPAVFNFMDMQDFPIPLPTTFFGSHWFAMVYGFFLAIIGNEVLSALSVEWRGRAAPDYYIVAFGIVVLTAVVLSLTAYAFPYSFFLAIAALGMLIYYSRVYLEPSRLGLNPTLYNYLLFITLQVATFITAFQVYFNIPWASLAFPVLSIISVMSRDIGLVFGGRKINDREMALAYLFLLLGLLVYPSRASSAMLFLGWLFSLHGSGLIGAKGRLYPRLSLTIAWTWLLASSFFSLVNYDAFVHSIAVGFLFNTIFGVDALLMDMLVAATGVRVKLKPSYVPMVVLNLGLIMRVAYDLNVTSPLSFLAAPLQGVGILSFYLNTFRQVIPQLRTRSKEAR